MVTNSTNQVEGTFAMNLRSSLKFYNGGVLGAEFLNDKLRRFLRMKRIAMGKDIHRCVAEFRPGMDTNMRATGKHQSAYALWSEMIEGFAQRFLLRSLRYRREGRFQELQIVECVLIAILQIQKEVLPQSVQLMISLSRTSRNSSCLVHGSSP